MWRTNSSTDRFENHPVFKLQCIEALHKLLYIHIELHIVQKTLCPSYRPVGAGLVQLFSSDEVQMFVNAWCISESPSPRKGNLPGRNIRKVFSWLGWCPTQTWTSPSTTTVCFYRNKEAIQVQDYLWATILCTGYATSTRSITCSADRKLGGNLGARLISNIQVCYSNDLASFMRLSNDDDTVLGL